MHRSYPNKTSGAALLIVLGGLVLLSVLTVGFLSMIRSELKSSKLYADSASARLLAESSVNIVLAQIKEGARSRDSSGARVAWVSQPGMIRNYDVNGSAHSYFKLYSSDAMKGTGAFTASSASEQPPASWSTDTGLYTDLNEPLLGRYPILNPDADIAAGFTITASHAAVSGKTNRAAMPVRWLYVLQDGQVVLPTGSGAAVTVAGATPANPIVGRIAFWTDDEASKININTASEGSFWDTPRALTKYEREDLAAYQPGRNEYQRYPGHPASTSLSVVLGRWLNSNPDIYSTLLPYYTIAPRVSGGGSESGTRLALTPVTTDADRLFANVDELLFLPSRQDLETSSISLKPEQLEQTRFFLTASSRAPDVNLFNKPRVGIWPLSVTDDANHRTAFDRLIAFCGTLNDSTYYFQRGNAGSSTADLPSVSSDTGLGRNRKLMEYLQRLTSAALPGFGGNFETKYGNDRDQILAEIFDYIRTTNLCDTNEGAASFVPYTRLAENAGKGQVVPTTFGNARGFGRFPTLSEAALLFTGIAQNTGVADPIPVDRIKVKAAFIPELFVPAFGWPTIYGDYKIRVTGMNNFSWGDSSGSTVSMGFPTSTTMTVAETTSPTLTRKWGGYVGFRSTMSNNATYSMVSGETLLKHPSPPALPVVSPRPTFHFTGGDITVEFLTNTDAVLQTITLRFPSGDFPVPQLADSPVAGSPTAHDFRNLATSANGRFVYTSKNNDGRKLTCWITSKDVVRSVVATSGDYRIVAGRSTITPADGLFAPLSSYSSNSETHSHALIESTGQPFYGAIRGRLIKDAQYKAYTKPQTMNDLGDPANFSVGGISTSTGQMDVIHNGVALGKDTAISGGDLAGDWDNAIGDCTDGPFTNKPDEGAYRDASNEIPYFDPNNFSQNSDAAGTFFSPNRQIPSAVMFGSLPSGVMANDPWQTLLFRPLPQNHPGLADPPDHLLLDLFHMPVVEPYAISEPLSTSGRINMNYQIVPFTYIRRDTGVRAVLASQRILAVPLSKAGTYKYTGNAADDNQPDLRVDIDVDQTMLGFDQRFDADKLFLSPSEVCSIHLVPKGRTYSDADMQSFWDANPLSGDNTRERPYADVYPRLTTKSNTFTVHFRVQTLQKSQQRIATAPTEFNPAKGDVVTGESRGSTIIERYVDPNDPNLPDFADASNFNSASSDLDAFYRFRTVGTRKFTP
jgi:uncharacterized protein (TIGR02600 family)